jgi:hypothetical protein
MSKRHKSHNRIPSITSIIGVDSPKVEKRNWSSSSPFRFDPNSDSYFGRYRLMNPDLCDPLTYRRRSGTRGISFLMSEMDTRKRDYGLKYLEKSPKGRNYSMIQEVIVSLLFDRQYWTERDAAAWWGSNCHKFNREWHSSMWKERGINPEKPLAPPYKVADNILEGKKMQEKKIEISESLLEAGNRKAREEEKRMKENGSYLGSLKYDKIVKNLKKQQALRPETTGGVKQKIKKSKKGNDNDGSGNHDLSPPLNPLVALPHSSSSSLTRQLSLATGEKGGREKQVIKK